jgi:integrase
VKRGVVPANPFANLPIGKSIAKRERVLSDDEIREIWCAAGDAAAPYGTIIRLLILTGQRRGEVAGMNWGEVTDDLTTWTMLGERTKNGAVHMVPLSGPAGVRLEVTEAVLNHISGSRGGIAGVYQRQDWAAEKRAALEAWAAHVTAVVDGRTPSYAGSQSHGERHQYP